MAHLDKTFYHGTDQYSDGDEAEDTLLQIVQEGKTLDDLEEASWPTVYHLSPIRENICNWYPFKKGSRVLEIGAGCGAVTGALCGKGLNVYCADLSLRRSTINYERHKEYDELHLMVGNLNDMSFPEPFDYILLIGVLEYAGKYTEGEHPYQTFLEHIRSFLKPDGILLIAIENRFGLKYFAGAPEDHLGEPFTGVRGYDPKLGIRTFSKSELTRLLEQSGFYGHQFYYPYPDYKFPLEIFTDETLVFQHYGKPYQVFDRERVEIFPETVVSSVLVKDGAAGAFANSFLVEATQEENGQILQVSYAKLNSGRRAPFCIGTKIYGDGKEKIVSKFSLNKAAEEHIQRIVANEQHLGSSKQVLCGKRKENEIVYPFSSFPTMEDALREAVDKGNAEAVFMIFEKIKDLAMAQPSDDMPDEAAFSRWFGDEKAQSNDLQYTNPANIDLVPDNIFADGDQLIISDCEWVIDFPVPVSFIVWRSIENVCLRVPTLEEILSKMKLYEKLGIRKDDIPAFRAWSHHFENVYVSSGGYARFAKPVRQAAYSPIRAEQMADELKNQAGHIEQLMESERELKGTVQSQSNYIDKLNTELQNVYNSKSWRMTKILRKIHQKLAGAGKNTNRE